MNNNHLFCAVKSKINSKLTGRQAAILNSIGFRDNNISGLYNISEHQTNRHKIYGNH